MYSFIFVHTFLNLGFILPLWNYARGHCTKYFWSVNKNTLKTKHNNAINIKENAYIVLQKRFHDAECIPAQPNLIYNRAYSTLHKYLVKCCVLSKLILFREFNNDCSNCKFASQDKKFYNHATKTCERCYILFFSWSRVRMLMIHGWFTARRYARRLFRCRLLRRSSKLLYLSCCWTSCLDTKEKRN